MITNTILTRPGPKGPANSSCSYGTMGETPLHAAGAWLGRLHFPAMKSDVAHDGRTSQEDILVQSGRGHQDDEAKIGSAFFQCFGRKIRPRARNDMKLSSFEA